MEAARSDPPAPSNSLAAQVFERLRMAAPLVVVDHARAGNAFFMRLFDRHPEVLVVPQVGYLPFHLTRMFGRRRRVPGTEVYEFAMSRTDFQYVANDLTEEIAREYLRQGDEPDTAIDRRLTRAVLEELCAGSLLTKADVIAAMHAAYAIGTGRDVSRVKYLLMNDSPLHYRGHLKCSIREAYATELSHALIVHLVRDPRATFASLRHQLVRQNNGMYRFSVRGLLAALRGIAVGSAGWCVAAHILSYTTAGSRELRRWRADEPAKICLVRNEDLNLYFSETMRRLGEFLAIEPLSGWSAPDYVPTSGGGPWRGTGAYNQAYRALTEEKIHSISGKSERESGYRFSLGISLADDPVEIARSTAGPNRYVTDRWRSRLTSHEIAFLEAVHLEEMAELGYSPLFVRDGGVSRLKGLLGCLYPMSGELFSFVWIRRQVAAGFVPVLRLILELCALPIVFLCARLAMLRLYFTGRLAIR